MYWDLRRPVVLAVRVAGPCGCQSVSEQRPGSTLDPHEIGRVEGGS